MPIPEIRFTNGELIALIAAVNQALNAPRQLHGLCVIELTQARAKLEAELELRL